MPLIDFVIITALLEEFEAVRDALPGELVEISSGANIYYRTTLSSNRLNRKYQVVVAFQSKMGFFDAISLSKECIDRWQPAYIIMTGIAGSFHKSIKLGDIAVAQQIFYYDMGKAVDQKKAVAIEYRPQGYPCSATLIRQAERLSLDKGAAWQKKALQTARKAAAKLKAKGGTKTLIKQLEEHKGGVHFGTMASGSQVITSEEKKDELLSLHGKIIATEMEGAGIMHQAYYQDPTVPAIIIKGISDMADSKKKNLDKDGHFRKLARQNAARFVAEMIQTGTFPGLNTDAFELVPDKGSPPLARTLISRPATPNEFSFLSFPHLVVPQGALTGITIDIQIKGTAGTRLHQVVVQYTDCTNKLRKHEQEGNSQVNIAGCIAASPIGVYLMIAGEAQSITFVVQTFGTKKETTVHITP